MENNRKLGVIMLIQSMTLLAIFIFACAFDSTAKKSDVYCGGISTVDLEHYFYNHPIDKNNELILENIEKKINDLEDTIKRDNSNYELVTSYEVVACRNDNNYGVGCFVIGIGDSEFVNETMKSHPRKYYKISSSKISSEYVRKESK